MLAITQACHAAANHQQNAHHQNRYFNFWLAMLDTPAIIAAVSALQALAFSATLPVTGVEAVAVAAKAMRAERVAARTQCSLSVEAAAVVSGMMANAAVKFLLSST